jgi:uncharacterized protein YjbI with pentapeptide repeats
MANQEHLDLLKQGSSAWNVWRAQHKEVRPDLSSADLGFADLSGADLSYANFSEATLREADLNRADLTGATLTGADLSFAGLSFATLNEADLTGANLSFANFSSADLIQADLSSANLSEATLRFAHLSSAHLSSATLRFAYLSEADLTGADLSSANLRRANLSFANLSEANLSGANLSRTILVGTNLANTILKDCWIYGISAWDVQLDGAEQLNLTITPYDQSIITVDNLKIAQFLYLLLNNKEIRDVINTLTTKSVLILGRFTPERKAVLDALREALRQHNYLPILFDFEPAHTQTVRETVSTLAHISHFIIADLTNPSGIPEELETIVPTLAVPIQPLLETTQNRESSMFKGYGVYDWVLPIYRYADLTGLLENVQEKVIEPATQKAQELEAKKVRLNQEPFEQTT